MLSDAVGIAVASAVMASDHSYWGSAEGGRGRVQLRTLIGEAIDQNIQANQMKELRMGHD